MKKTFFARLKNRIGNHNNFFYFSNLKDGNDLYVEDYFVEILKHERRRAERSKKPFLLMLMDIENISTNGRKANAVEKIASLLSSTTREIDIKGWYKNDSAIGIIFTELNGTDKVELMDKIHNKLYNAIQREDVSRIKISFYSYPEEDGGHKQNNDSSMDITLYPDLRRIKCYRKTALYLKRAIDITGSISALAAFSPLFLAIALFIKLTSKGPVFFKQERIGESGKRFTFFKFRSMYINNDSNIHKAYIKKFILEQRSYEEGKGKGEGMIYKIKDDPRITPIGRFLRKTSLDEMPQFINVLKGDMSLVGPRPPIPYEIEEYDLWHKRRVIEVKPGITGLWQVYGRSLTTFDEMVRMDLRYVREWSLWLDIKLLFQTPWAVLKGKGAY